MLALLSFLSCVFALLFCFWVCFVLFAAAAVLSALPVERHQPTDGGCRWLCFANFVIQLPILTKTTHHSPVSLSLSLFLFLLCTRCRWSLDDQSRVTQQQTVPPVHRWHSTATGTATTTVTVTAAVTEDRRHRRRTNDGHERETDEHRTQCGVGEGLLLLELSDLE